jgi:hypothetical protein
MKTSTAISTAGDVEGAFTSLLLFQSPAHQNRILPWSIFVCAKSIAMADLWDETHRESEMMTHLRHLPGARQDDGEAGVMRIVMLMPPRIIRDTRYASIIGI